MNMQTQDDKSQGTAIESMSTAFSAWMRNANRLQCEAIRFVADRFAKDVEMTQQFAKCKKPEEILDLQAKLVNAMMSDYMNESAKFLTLFSDIAKEGFEEIARNASTKPTR